MGKAKLVAIATADLHLHDWKAYSEKHSRLLLCFELFEELIAKATDKGVPLLISGDLIHNPKTLDNTVFARLMEVLGDHSKQTLSTPILCITGNHDELKTSMGKRKSVSYVQSLARAFPKFVCLDEVGLAHGKTIFYGIPYLHKNKGFKEALATAARVVNSKIYHNHYRVLLLHSDFPGAITNLNHSTHEVDGIDTAAKGLFNKFDLVIMGHIHLKQKLGDNVYMLGAPYQQTWGDSGVETGYWEIYSNNPPVFIPLKNYPKFIKLDSGKKMTPDGNFYSIASKKEVNALIDTNVDFSLKLDKRSLLTNYLKISGNQSTNREALLMKVLAKLDKE